MESEVWPLRKTTEKKTKSYGNRFLVSRGRDIENRTKNKLECKRNDQNHERITNSFGNKKLVRFGNSQMNFKLAN